MATACVADSVLMPQDVSRPPVLMPQRLGDSGPAKIAENAPKVAVSALFDATHGDFLTAVSYQLFQSLIDRASDSEGTLVGSADFYRKDRPEPNLVSRAIFASSSPAVEMWQMFGGSSEGWQENAVWRSIEPLKEAPWSGYRHYEVDCRGVRVTRQQAEPSTSPSTLKQSIAENTRRYPGALQVVPLVGHGYDSRYVCGSPADKWQDMKADVLIALSCNVNSFQTLRTITKGSGCPGLVIGSPASVPSIPLVASWGNKPLAQRLKEPLKWYNPFMDMPGMMSQLSKAMSKQEMATELLSGPDSLSDTFAVDLDEIIDDNAERSMLQHVR